MEIHHQIRTLKKYKATILNYFKRRKNNGFVEGLNNKIKVIKRWCYGLYKTESIFQRLFLDLKEYKVAPRISIPECARGYEAIYEQFLRGVLIYRPTSGTDVGKIELPIASLLNSLESTFDLSRCGDAGQYLSISTGYRKGKIAANASKYEVWIAPKFVVESDLSKTASHYRDIMGKWTAPYGIFYTWGGWEDLTWYDYLTESSAEEISSKDLYENWRGTDQQLVDVRYAHPNTSKHFAFQF